MEDASTSEASQRFQVKISGQWNDYNPKEDEVLKAAFDNFIRKTNDETLSPQESFKELVIKGRRYIVDFQKMVQVRKDNKKDYKVRPPPGSPILSSVSEDGQREQGRLKLKCEQCDREYTLRTFGQRSDSGDWADCRYCQDCWRPFLDKEKQVEEKKVEKNQKQRQVQQPCRVSPNTEKASLSDAQQPHADEQKKLQSEICGYCGQPFQDDQAVFLGACDKHCELCHDECGKKQDPDALALARLYSIEYPKFFMLNGQDINPGSNLKRTIQEEYRRHEIPKDNPHRPTEITAY